jgi:hypothetical protein
MSGGCARWIFGDLFASRKQGGTRVRTRKWKEDEDENEKEKEKEEWGKRMKRKHPIP